jgi:excisionase family DNA binding protein
MIAIANEKFMTVEETAKLFNKTRTTIEKWIRDGKLERTKAGGSVLIPERALARMLEAE